MPTASAAETVATAVTITLVLLVAATAVTAGLAVRGVRRSYRRLRGRAITALLIRRNRPALALVMRATPAASPAWWMTQLDRRQLWRSVSAAEHAVATAKSAGAPVGDLPSLTRQLHRAAQTVDRALVAGSRSRARVPPTVQLQRRDVQQTADRIHTAALESLAASGHDQTIVLASTVRTEIEALQAGLRSARACLPGS